MRGMPPLPAFSDPPPPAPPPLFAWTQEHLQGYKLPQVWEDLLPAQEVMDLMRTTCNRPLKIVNKISREVGRGWQVDRTGPVVD